MREQLEERLKRFIELEQQMTNPEVLANSSRMAAIAREHGTLVRMATSYRKFKEISQEISDARELVQGDDLEMRELAELEIPQLILEREKVWNELLEMTVGGEDAHRSRCVMEIRAGTGGDEAALFARDLYEMYKRHAEIKKWKVELLGASPTELGGFKEITLGFSGTGVFRELHYESGGHRVQRVPETEAKGRIHTSAATVAVLPEPEDIEVDLKSDDYRKDIYHASGPGGQHVNKTASAIRLTHFETGIVVAIQDEKSQHKNLAKGLRILKSRIYDLKQQEDLEKRANERKTMVGSGDRSQRIRTYNFPENRVTHHSINLTLYKLDQLLAGNLDLITTPLIERDRDELRESMGADLD